MTTVTPPPAWTEPPAGGYENARPPEYWFVPYAVSPEPPTGGEQPPAALPPRRTGWRGLVRGRAEDPAWVRPTLWALLAANAVLYLWDLGSSRWANAYYSAAVQAGSASWKAF